MFLGECKITLANRAERRRAYLTKLTTPAQTTPQPRIADGWVFRPQPSIKPLAVANLFVEHCPALLAVSTVNIN